MGSDSSRARFLSRGASARGVSSSDALRLPARKCICKPSFDKREDYIPSVRRSISVGVLGPGSISVSTTAVSSAAVISS